MSNDDLVQGALRRLGVPAQAGRSQSAPKRQKAIDPPPIQPGDTINEEIVIEPAATNSRPIFWECGTGEILGPAKLEFLAKVGSGPKERYRVIAIYHDLPVWIRSECLRSKQQFANQVKPTEVHVCELNP